VLGIIVVAFLAFIVNTLRCYLMNPKNDEDDDFDELENQNYQNPNERNFKSNN
jgi:Co/Zn/Cd efflux system component